MKNFMISALVLATTVANAEVKPQNTILDEVCGNLNRSVQICIARNITTHQAFLKVHQFMKDPVYVVAKEQAVRIGTVGARTMTYTAGVVELDRDSRYPIEHMYRLDVTTIINPRYPVRGTLSVDNESPRTFEMEPMVHTESL